MRVLNRLPFLYVQEAGGGSFIAGADLYAGWKTVPVPIFPPVRGEFYALAEAISFNVKNE